MLDGYVMDDLVVCPLHKGGVDITEHPHSLRGHTRTEGDRMLFTDADIECPVRHSLHHEFQRGTAGHRRRDPEDLWILLRQLDQRMPEHILVFGRLWGSIMFLVDLTSYFVEKPRGMPLGLILLRKRITLALYRYDMQQLGPEQLLQVAK